MKPRLTMAAVATAAGVHQTTVSLALRNDPRLGAATRERIQKLAKEMGYRPNPLVSALIAERRKGRETGRGSVLAFLIGGRTTRRESWRGSKNYAKIFSAMQVRSAELGYGLEEFWLGQPGMRKERMREILLNRGIRGIVVCPLPGTISSLDFDFSDFASVALGYTLRTPQLDRVCIDYFAIMGDCIQHLIAQGHRRIGFATTSAVDSRVEHLSLARFLVEKHQHPSSFVRALMREEWTEAALLKWIDREQPDAVISPTTPDFSHFQKILQQAGIPVPKQLSLVNVDCYVDSTEAGIVQNLAGESCAAINLVTSRVERAQFGLPSSPQTISVSGTWRDGWSFCSRFPETKGKNWP